MVTASLFKGASMRTSMLARIAFVKRLGEFKSAAKAYYRARMEGDRSATSLKDQLEVLRTELIEDGANPEMIRVCLANFEDVIDTQVRLQHRLRLLHRDFLRIV